jgi:hypothetical protein
MFSRTSIRGRQTRELGQSVAEFALILAAVLVITTGCRHLIAHYVQVVFYKVSLAFHG